jgi:hypothetical protein
MIKIKNSRVGGSLFHYAHFICDCLLPEIINDLYKYNKVIRKKNIHQTIGNFNKMYTDIMQNENIELDEYDFINLKINRIIYKNKEEYCNKIYFDKFTNFIFKRYGIDNLIFDEKYSEIILIKRDDRVELIDDIELKNINTNFSTGRERREIDKIDSVEEYLKKKYNNKFKSIFLEKIPFEKQVKIFNNAKIIICAHGAAMANMFFCKEHTKIIEVTCGKEFNFFDIISKNLNLNHIKCHDNVFDKIIDCLKLNEI